MNGDVSWLRIYVFAQMWSVLQSSLNDWVSDRSSLEPKITLKFISLHGLYVLLSFQPINFFFAWLPTPKWSFKLLWLDHSLLEQSASDLHRMTFRLWSWFRSKGMSCYLTNFWFTCQVSLTGITGISCSTLLFLKALHAKFLIIVQSRFGPRSP